MKKEMTPPKDNIAELQRTHELIYEQAAILSRSEDIPTAIQGMLAAIGSFVNAERAYIFEDKGTHYSNTFEWCAPGIRPEKDNLREIDLDTISAWTDILIHGECIIISELESIKEEYPRVYDILKPQSISNVVEAPIMVDNHLIGFLGVDNSPVKTSQRVAETLQVLGTFIAITLKNQEGRLESLEQANTALSETNAALRVAYESANQANAAKTTFLSKMSHDIRTPMNAIIGYTNIALNYIDNREKVQSCLHKILTSSSHLLNLFNDILNMSHIENGEMQIKEQECSLPELIDDVLDILQPQVKAKHLELSVNTYDVVDEDIIADPLKLCQIFVNLLGNSVKYTLAGGRIIFDIYQKKAFGQDFGDYIFIVRDNGIGMYPEFIEHIYEPFERESTVTKSGIRGVGIGMTITKHIVDMMGGTIAVRSRKGEGSEFQVELRMRLQDGEKSAVQVEELTGLRVMVVDDSADRCDSVCSMLGLLGMRVERAFTPKEAIARAGSVYNEEDPFRVYIIDWQMAEKDGTEVIKKIREIIGKNVPIMILTSYDGGDTEKKWKIAGADVFCARPLFISGLKSALLSVIHPSEKEKVSPVKVDFKGRRVLLVDDNEMNREIAETVLTESGFLVETASDGTDAVVMVQRSEEHYYDAVLTDIQMPVMDGYEAARAIRTLDREDVHTLPIIAISANGMEEDKEMALVSGINDWIDKPLYVDAFIEVLTKYLAE